MTLMVIPKGRASRRWRPPSAKKPVFVTTTRCYGERMRANGTEILVALDGPGVSPATVEPLALLQLAEAVAAKALRVVSEAEEATEGAGGADEDARADNDRWELTELRAVPIRVGGAEVTARLRSTSEAAPFTVSLSETHARTLGAHLYEAVDVELRLRRGADDLIKGGEVIDVHVLDVTPPAGGWRAWLKETAAQWDDVDDVSGELGRRD